MIKLTSAIAFLLGFYRINESHHSIGVSLGVLKIRD